MNLITAKCVHSKELTVFGILVRVASPNSSTVVSSCLNTSLSLNLLVVLWVSLPEGKLSHNEMG